MKRSLFWLLDQYPETGESVAAVHEAALEEAVEADRLGFTSLWLAEHHFRTLGTVPNPAVLLTAIAQRTEHLRLGPAAVVLPLRNPIHVAEEYALLDALSGGRLNMGVGTGSQPTEYTPFGVDFELRRQLYAENLSTVRKLWKAAASGELGPNSINVAPLQSPAPPIYVASMHEEGAYQIGLACDSLLTLIPPPATGVDEAAARVRAHARGLEDAGHAATSAESVVMMFAHAADTESEARATAVPALVRLMNALRGVQLPDPEAFYEQMRRSDVGLFGTPTEVGHQLQRLSEVGIEHVAFVSRFGGMPRESALRSLRLLAPSPVLEPSPS